MPFLYLIPFYAKWHYTEGFQDLSRNWKSFIFFVLHFFSIGFLFKTWFAPFSRLNEEYKKGFNPEDFFETLAVNTLMRLVGFILRTIIIAAGLSVLLLVALIGPLALVLWALSPIIFLVLFILGVANLLF